MKKDKTLRVSLVLIVIFYSCVGLPSARMGLVQSKISQIKAKLLKKQCLHELETKDFPGSCFSNHNLSQNLDPHIIMRAKKQCFRFINANKGKNLEIWEDLNLMKSLPSTCREKLMLAKQIYFYKIEAANLNEE